MRMDGSNLAICFSMRLVILCGGLLIGDVRHAFHEGMREFIAASVEALTFLN